MIHRVRALVTVLALCVPSLAVADQVKRKAPDPVSTYLAQDRYTYCDVKVLSGLWKQSVSDAKATVGLKLQAKREAALEKMLGDARAAARKTASLRCTFGEAGLTYEDAVTLGKLWKKTETAAKALAEEKILAGSEKSLRAMLKKQPANQDPTSTFLQQDVFTYCDVKLLAKLWKTSASQAKATIGVKLQNKNEAYLKTQLVAARKDKSVTCDYADGAFSYEDLEKLAKLWKMPVGDVKSKVGTIVRNGGAADLRPSITGPAGNVDADLTAFLEQKKYTYCDAAQIAAMWKTSIDEAKSFIGAKLNMGSPASVDGTLAEARKLPKVEACKKPPPSPPRPKTKQ